ncbi:phage tail protein [Lysinibacillus fusiformis]|uniref:phage tail protein n=1 Tax=Lysinibacillus fusiformis TaxID=28031 RepID=UPI00263B37E2|nr:phage tail tape measure protein [Lysinibacillus fusiformis]MDC6266656.1 phage tail tape measure protein [Lysinibacillus sphaericus]MDN4970531.1 phage tail tape measure protein [Lysinibacillus fusiformis]
MAVNLTAIFRVRDQGTSRLRQITSMMDRMNRTSRTTSDSMSRSQSAVNRLGNATSSAFNRMNGFGASISRLHVSSNGLSASIGGLQSTLIGLAGAYLTAQGAAKAFESTILAAANYEMSSVTIGALFDDAAKTKKYMQSVEKMALDSPILNSTEMYSSSKGLIAMTKDLDTLAKTWSIIERLQLLDPAQGTEGASFAMKEMFGGDAISLSSRFELPKGELNRIKKLDPAGQVVELDKMLVKMGYTQKAVNKMSETTLSQWSQITEKAQVFGRKVGDAGNTKLGDALRNINKYLEKLDVDVIAKRLGDKLGELTDKAIAFGKLLWQWREPIVYVVGAIAAAVGTLAGVGVIAALANPVSLIAAGIAAAVVGFKALYDNSEMFRGAIDGIVGKVKSLWSAFKTGGTGGLISALFPPDIANQINSLVGGIKAKISGLMTAFKSGGFKGVLEMLISPEAISAMTSRFATIKEQVISVFTSLVEAVLPVLQTLWSTAQPILSALWDALKIVADVVMLAWNNIIAPTITFVMKTFKLMWTVIGPILELLGAAIGAAFKILRLVWDTIVGPFVAFLAGGFTQAFGAATEIVNALAPVFQKVGGWISKAAGYLREFTSILGKVKIPDWIGNIGSGAVSWAKKLIPGKDGGATKSHYSGLDSVPYDGYSARLHKNEKVLTAQQAKAYDEGQGGSSGGIVISGNNFTVREDADIQRIAYELAKLIEKERMQVG